MPELLRVEDLHIAFGGNEVVRGISFAVAKGETLAVVGESGSGKSVTALSLTRLLPSPPVSYPAGKIWLENQDVLKMSEAELRKIRGKKIAYVFQEPSTSLNPVKSIRSQLAETLQLHRRDVMDQEREIIYWLEKVGIVNAGTRLDARPFQLSGGMQQRVMIAMALCAQPQLLVADEPTTALDVTTQAQVIGLLKTLKADLKMSILMITHNFGLVKGLADRVIVMYRGEIVEEGDVERVIGEPQHPYTKALIACIPRMGAGLRRLPVIGDFAEVR
jgi:ABC-type dipeptide/oligopeptide/nickel transport system ATPase component